MCLVHQALADVQERDGCIKLRHFRRVKQLGSGDVGLIDLVQLQGTEHKFAMKTADQHETQVGRLPVAGGQLCNHMSVWGTGHSCRAPSTSLR